MSHPLGPLMWTSRGFQTGDDVVVRITATPVNPADGPTLADEVVAVLDSVASRRAA